MLEPLGFQGGPRVAPSRPKAPQFIQNGTQINDFPMIFGVCCIVREHSIHHKVPGTFRSALPLQVWGGEGGERGETLGEVGMKAPSHFGVHLHKKAGPKKTPQKRFPIIEFSGAPQILKKRSAPNFRGGLEGAPKRASRPGSKKRDFVIIYYT